MKRREANQKELRAINRLASMDVADLAALCYALTVKLDQALDTIDACGSIHMEDARALVARARGEA
jgi:hypothetical protein